MIRAVLPSVLLFLLPFVLYAGWLAVQKRRGAHVAHPRAYLYVAAVGLALAALGLLFFVDFEAAEPDGVYVPPRYEDGRLVPGHFAPRGDAAP
jgi:hypothetical protein